MSREEIIDALQDDKLVDYIQPWLLDYIVNFVILNYTANDLKIYKDDRYY